MDLGNIVFPAIRAAIGVPAAAYALAALGLNVHFGYTGLSNFGQVGFMLVGAYGTAITVDNGGPLWLGVLVGIGAAVILGLLLGLPTLRLRADYLAIVTIATAEILRLLTRTQRLSGLTKGVFGIQRFANDFYRINPIPDGRYGIGQVSFSARNLWVILVGWGLVALVSLLTFLLVRSPWGRVLKSIREDEDAARSLGKSVFTYKLQSLVLGGVFGALAGILLAIDTQSVNPDTYLAVVTFFAYTVLVLGGPAKVLGPVLGSVVFWLLLQLTDGILREGFNMSGGDVGAIRFALVGLGLMLLMIFRPQGIIGTREGAVLDDR
ncbi:MAG: branched-chain amino acid transporter permease [Acidimicrobiales bacterium]|jgi:branched-chain amino acid transport system permease protein|nr:branched-chain amino acid transporter permease [Acidimicrobiales bacterium]